ncbi:hypothetical protein PIB30_081848 [Stylosanthes scabra]|uniref:Uncharacterized protein n=1 Tax=Stylosanthes scabra TaxID=79078 RepID=A0ABU6WTF4_9FABA|nr:hypothetical protein [Stylosanthes scabra]
MEFVQTTTTFIEQARTNFRNQESAIRNLETQMGQIARQFSTPMPNAFPSKTMVNPTVECYAINIRSGEALQDSKQEGLNKEDVRGTPTKPTKEEMVMNAIQYPEEDEEDWYMRIDVIEELNREVQQEDAIQKFQAKQGSRKTMEICSCYISKCSSKGLSKFIHIMEKCNQPFQPSPFLQPITLPPPPQPKPPQANFEAALEKLTMTTLEFVQTTTTFIEEARTNFRNQESSIRNLVTQVGKIATQLSTNLPN